MEVGVIRVLRNVQLVLLILVAQVVRVGILQAVGVARLRVRFLIVYSVTQVANVLLARVGIPLLMVHVNN